MEFFENNLKKKINIEKIVLIEPSELASYRAKEFPSSRINLNTATIGLPSQKVQNALTHVEDEVLGYPLGQYDLARNDLKQLRKEAQSLWQTTDYSICFTLSATQTSNMLSHVLLETNYLRHKQIINVLATSFEHLGGI